MSVLELSASRVAYCGLLVASEAKVGADRARETALYLLVTSGGVPGALAAQAYGCTKQYVSRILREVEDQRDDPAYEAAVSELEQRIFQAVR